MQTIIGWLVVVQHRQATGLDISFHFLTFVGLANRQNALINMYRK